MVEPDTNDDTPSYFGNLLGIIIAKPLELKIFEKEVNKQLNTIIQRNKSELQAKINNRIMQQSGPYDKEKAEINSKLAAYQKSYDSASVELEKKFWENNQV